MYKWPLNINNFNLLDRLKICLFFLNYKNRWTADKYVQKFEKEMAKFVGVKYAVFTSNGSTANTILAMYLRDRNINLDIYDKNIIIFPSTTWSTSITPFLREGFEPEFIDVNLNDLSFDLNELNRYLSRNHRKVNCVFITSLLGFVPDIKKLSRICSKYKVPYYMDNCECNFGKYGSSNISSLVTSTTSTYFGHQLQSIEGGFIFTNNYEEYCHFLLYRNHGMTRSLPNDVKDKFENKLVDSKFDFYLKGNNFRNTDVNAFIGLLDFNKRYEYKEKRNKLYCLFKNSLDENKYIIPHGIYSDWDLCPFSIPIILKNSDKKQKIIEWCEKNSIETRPVISGNLLRQTCFKKYGDYRIFENSEHLDNFGIYVGLHNKLKESDILKLTNFLNNL